MLASQIAPERTKSLATSALPDAPVITRVSPISSRKSRGLTSCLPSGVRTSMASSSTVPSTHAAVVTSGSARPSSLAMTRPCKRMIAARYPANWS